VSRIQGRESVCISFSKLLYSRTDGLLNKNYNINTENVLAHFEIKESLLPLVNWESIKYGKIMSLSARTWHSTVKTRLGHHVPDCSVTLEKMLLKNSKNS
jgi:hypothetical protein